MFRPRGIEMKDIPCVLNCRRGVAYYKCSGLKEVPYTMPIRIFGVLMFVKTRLQNFPV